MSAENSTLDPPKVEPVKVELRGYVDSRLRDLVVAFAEEQDIPLSECVAHLVAKAMKRPDLGEVPRKRIGRRRKEHVEQAHEGQP